jgi:hypothetical protein
LQLAAVEPACQYVIVGSSTLVLPYKQYSVSEVVAAAISCQLAVRLFWQQCSRLHSQCSIRYSSACEPVLSDISLLLLEATVLDDTAIPQQACQCV